MRKTWGVVVALLLLTPAPQLCAAEKKTHKFFFKKGDRIVFLGDSITQQYQYSSTIELYLTTRFPKWDLTFLNAGISGDRASGGSRRFQNDVLAEHPTAVTIDFGMNDGGYGKFDGNQRDQFISISSLQKHTALPPLGQPQGRKNCHFSGEDHRDLVLFRPTSVPELADQSNAPKTALAELRWSP